MTKLGVNIDHIATIRQARQAIEPDPVAAAVLAEMAGADGITVHLRGDRRHIRDNDVRRLRETVTTRLNLEMAPTAEMVRIALHLRPVKVLSRSSLFIKSIFASFPIYFQIRESLNRSINFSLLSKHQDKIQNQPFLIL